MTENKQSQPILDKLRRLYGEAMAPAVFEKIMAVIGESPAGEPLERLPLSERDVILITYGDQVQRPGDKPLRALHTFLKRTVGGVINTVHILPFYPYSSDDGFSVIDYYAVDPALGDWQAVNAMGRDFRLMFDGVFNHISSKSGWFQAFLRGEKPYDGYFITVDPETDLSGVVRPRALPLLTAYQTDRGEKHLWTTFSEDQIDLNVSNPDVLIELIRALLFYVQQGASLIRLDAIAFLWKEIGTSCIHLEQTHLIIQLLRDVLDRTAPSVVLITETNVPHEENLSYFGDGRNEAQMVYQFALPPLLLHTLLTGDASTLSHWAETLALPGSRTTFFNFTASHDGIGLRPASGILGDDQIAALVKMVESHGGFVSYRAAGNGSRSPYELNITYFDAITHPDITAAQPDTAVQRFMVSQAIALALVGVPGIYFQSLFGSRNYVEGVRKTGHYRTINRQKFQADALTAEMQPAESIRRKVYERYMQLLRVRTNEPAFHPLGGQRVIHSHPQVFALERTGPDGRSRVITLHNVCGHDLTLRLDLTGGWHDLLSGTICQADSDSLVIPLRPYQVAWLKEN